MSDRALSRLDDVLLNRRTVLQGSAAVAVAAMAPAGNAFFRTPLSVQPAVAAPAPPAFPGPVTPLALPMLSDGMNIDRPEYYETLQAGHSRTTKTWQTADLNGDGQDELVIRGPAGILAYVFDADSGQWWTLPGNAPAMSDAAGWGAQPAYTTIQTADIDGDGRAELIGCGPEGLVAFDYTVATQQWNQMPGAPVLTDVYMQLPFYYSTMQCADIDGDGADEVLVRSPTGLLAYKYTGSGWQPLPTLTQFSDANGWLLPQLYSTIQCADINGDGKAEVLSLSLTGLVAWAYSGSGWQQLATLSQVSSPQWGGNPAYFSTLQCADVDGDGRAELIGRSPTGIVGWRFSGTGPGQWQALANGPGWSDVQGWSLSPYYSTIQLADINGDGRAELFARSETGINTYAFVGSGTGSWQQLANGPAWSDAQGWFGSQYGSSIQTARVKGSAVNANNPVSAGHTAAALLGRSATGIEVWRYGTPAWTRTSAPWPAINPVAYAAVSTLLGITSPLGVRGLYNDQLANVTAYHQTLTTSPPPSPPAGYAGTQSSWNAAVAQLGLELFWVLEVNSWYVNLNTLITDTYVGDAMSVSVVRDTIMMKQSNNGNVALSVLSLLFNAAWAVLGIPEGGQVFAAVAGLLATACQAATTQWGGGDTIAGTITSVETALVGLFDQALASAAAQQVTITGGTDPSGSALPGDYGLLAAIGRQIDSGVAAWTWTDTTPMVVAAQRSYATSVWQMLETPQGWRWSVNLEKGFAGDKNLSAYETNQWFWNTGGGNASCDTYFMCQYETFLGLSAPVLIEAAVMQALSGATSATSPFPLGVPPADVVRGVNGWPQVKSTLTAPFYSGCSNLPSPYAASDSTAEVTKSAPTDANPLPSRDVHLTVATTLSRDTRGQVVAAVRVSNSGLTPATNVEIIDATMRGRRADGHLPTRQRRIDDGKSTTFHLRFEGVPGKASQPVQLHLSGRYRGGTFEQKVQLFLP